MKLFSSRKEKRGKLYASIALFLVIFSALYLGLQSVSTVTVEEQKRSLEEALRRSAVHCYTTEGAYPESLSYLLSYYPVIYDEELFFVDYRPVASNLMPDITVIELQP